MIKFLLKWRGVKLVFVTGKKSQLTADFICNLISDFCKVKRIDNSRTLLKKFTFLFYDVVVISDDNEKPKDLQSLFTNFKEVIGVINSDNLTKEKEIIQGLKKTDTLLVDFENMEKIPGKKMRRFLSYGFDSGADFYVSDMNTSDRTNFKINYDGSSVPVWIDKNSSKVDVLKVTAGLGVGVLLGVNFVSLTQKIKK